MNSANQEVSLCIFKLCGFKSCIGCGIGHSIHSALHFDLKISIEEHILGIPATLIILHHIVKPFLPIKIKTKWTNNKCL